jgi:arabinan endo-1,5-alpha-L-arabinosidase
MGRPGLKRRSFLGAAGGLPVAGPYTDSTGTPMPEGGGDLVPASHGRYIGPGGESAFSADGTTWLAHHYDDANDDGTPGPGLNRLGRRSDWPVVK